VELLNVKPNTFEQRPLNPQVTGNMLPATQCFVACRNFGKGKKRKGLLSLSLAKPRQNTELILQTYELFICAANTLYD
jgi:hypothetical protein